MRNLVPVISGHCTSPVPLVCENGGVRLGCVLAALATSTGCGRIGFEPLAGDEEIPVSEPGANGSDPSLAWTGDGFGIAWHEAGTLYVRLLDRRARPLGEPRAVATGECANASLVWTGAGFGLTWQQAVDGEIAIFFAALDPSGAPTGAPTRVSASPSQAADARLAWLGDGFAAAWWDASGTVERVAAAYLDPSGALQRSLPIGSGAAEADDIELAAADGELALVWEDDADVVARLHFARLDGAGDPLTAATAITDTSAAANAAAIVADGDGWLLAYEHGADLRLLELSRDGSTGTTVPLWSGYDPVVAVAGGRTALGWEEGPTDAFPAHVAFLDDAGEVVGAPRRLGTDAGASDLSLAWTGDALAVAWEDQRHGPDTIYVLLIAPP